MDTLIVDNDSTATVGSASNRRIEGGGTSAAEWDTCYRLASLPRISVEDLIGAGRRVVIVAPHPDDEILGCGGLVQLLESAHSPVALVAITDGDASHPDSKVWPAQRLVRERPAETLQALAALDVSPPDIQRLSVPDGQVMKFQLPVQAALERLLRPSDTVLTTWRFDGHPDHEATGKACAAAVATVGARLVEIPIWSWHWARPGDMRIPWHRARKLMLNAAVLEKKRAAVACYRSQLENDGSTGRPPILPPSALARLLRPYEIYFI
ncbi:PIG-L deacetylase family protein [Undibacterium sp. TJN25]|uniref:PIG-L deacetylase family protein n=1 Tax=Undibacterium sp. TJN25 TaxID=3413056 RepID=UPI003BEFBED6